MMAPEEEDIFKMTSLLGLILSDEGDGHRTWRLTVVC
jgi:hypothetical protein